MRKIGVWLALGWLLHAPIQGRENLVRVPTTSKQQLLHLLRSGMDVAYVEPEGKFVDVVADSGEIILMKFWGFAPFVSVADLRAQGAGRLGAAMGGYHTYDEVKVFLDSVAAARPDLVSPVFSIGRSLEGKKIWAIKVSNSPLARDSWDRSEIPPSTTIFCPVTNDALALQRKAITCATSAAVPILPSGVILE